MEITVAEARKLLRNLKPSDSIELSLIDRNAMEKFKPYTSKEDILNALYGPLRGQEITLTEAAEKYDVPRSVLSAWNYRSNYIAPLNSYTYPATFDEADIAYLVDIYRARQQSGSKAPLLNGDGLPYEIKHPDLARYRRQKKQN